MPRTDIPYSAKEVIDKIDIGDSTLRKWCLSLEKQNYNFIRTDQNKRLFTEKDVFVLSQFKVLVQDKNMSINNAATIVASKYVNESFSNETEIEQVSKHQTKQLFSNETLEELKTEMEQLKSINTSLLYELEEQKKDRENQKEFNEELLNRLNQFQNYIENKFEEDVKSRQHDRELVSSLKESMEQQKLIAAAQEEERKKRGFFSRLFGK
jgi:hypothetical protein